MQYISAETLRERLISEEEISVVDIRLQEDFIRGHILASVNIPLDRLDIEAYKRIPRTSVHICIVGHTDAAIERAISSLDEQGYTNVSVLRNGLRGWLDTGLATFEDMNAGSKIFGEFIEHVYETPNVSPQALYESCARGDGPIIVDCRPTREHVSGHIPGAIHVPGGDLIRTMPLLVADKSRQVVIHCGGRTRGIIAAQALINAGVSNPVAVLANGTMGWHLCGYPLEKGQARDFPNSHQDPAAVTWAEAVAKKLRHRLGIKGISEDNLSAFIKSREEKSLYVFDLRPVDETRSTPFPIGTAVSSGQLIQATDEFIAIRNARVVLVDSDPARAAITASWLQQMGWTESYVLTVGSEMAGAKAQAILSRPSDRPTTDVDYIEPDELLRLIQQGAELVIIDLSQSHEYLAGHIAGAIHCRRSELTRDILHSFPPSTTVVLTSVQPPMSEKTASDLRSEDFPVRVLKGGVESWKGAGQKLVAGVDGLLSETSWLSSSFARAIVGREELVKEFVEWELERFFDPSDIRPIEDAMRKYLRWEIDLVKDLQRDTTIRFRRLG